MKFKMGKIYEVEYIDHYATNDKSSQEAVHNGDCRLKMYGVFIGENPKYVIMCWNFDGLCDGDNNDNLHILKKGIVNARELH